MENPFHRQAAAITFRDTDASGWMHFTNVFHHVEVAEHACLRKLDLLVFDRAHGGWPRVHVDCDYRRPLLCGDEIEVQLAIASLGASSVTWKFEVMKATGERSATGTLVTVRVDHQGKPQPLSAEERSALEAGIR